MKGCREPVNAIIYGKIRNFIINEDIEDCCKILQNATGYFKKNGEFYSTALALYLSRTEGNEFNENILKVHFITDDDGVTILSSPVRDGRNGRICTVPAVPDGT
ncbi:MAG: hypothetical protein GY749_32330 [Desulfobacteraceae bacterium]|nr:hypothetical protein [Desulfobacteraceae bacterium]